MSKHQIIIAFSLLSLSLAIWPARFVSAEAVAGIMPAAVEQPTEPDISVGLWKTKETVKFTSPFAYEVWTGGTDYGLLAPNRDAQLSYKNGFYYFTSPEIKFQSSDYIRLAPTDPTAYYIIPNLTRKTSAKSRYNYNAYRGEMIYKFSPLSAMPYVINKLPLDSYVAGIGEAADSSPEEYLKALLVAARSYGYYFIGYGDSAKKMFDVYASTVDQLYLGYYSEISRPRVAAAALDTYGQMVNYDGRPVITPYFGNSNGRTKSWSQVWGGADKPWLQPVECAYDKGRRQWGHGVGMSTRDAMLRAGKDGWTYMQITGYYYAGTYVERMY